MISKDIFPALILKIFISINLIWVRNMNTCFPTTVEVKRHRVTIKAITECYINKALAPNYTFRLELKTSKCWN